MSNVQTPVPAAVARRPARVWRARALKIVLLLVVFLAGGAAGGSLTTVYFYHHLSTFMRSPERAKERFLAKFHGRYPLDPERTERVDEIVNRHFARMDAIRVETYPRLDAELNRFETELAAQLDEPQRGKWQADFHEVRERIFPPPPPAQ